MASNPLEDVRKDLATLRRKMVLGDIDEDVFQRRRQLILEDLTPEEQRHLGTATPQPVVSGARLGPSGTAGDGVRTALPSLADLELEPGAVLFQQWRIERELGRGGFGVVFEAHELLLDQRQAIKVLDPAMVARAELLARFRREVALMRRLVHPRVVRVYDYREDLELSQALISMELVAGGSAKDLALLARETGKPLSLPLILRVLGQVLEALAVAHAQGVIHRDVTPGNILFVGGPATELLAVSDRDPGVKLVDFGIAGLAEKSDLSERSQALGTAAYVAPEILDPLSKEHGPPADIYGAAAVIYELLTGRPPLGRFTEPSKSRPGLPAPVDKLILSMLRRHPSERPSATESLEEFRKLLRFLRQLVAEHKADERRKRRVEAEAKRQAEKQRQRQAEAEAKHQAEKQRKRQAEAEAKRQAEKQRKRQAEAEAKRQAEEQRKRQAEEQRKRQAEAEAKRQAEAETKRQAEEQRKRQTEANKKRQAEDQRERQAEAEAKRQAEEQRKQQAEAEAKCHAEEQRKRHAEEQRKNQAEAEAKRQAEEERTEAEQKQKRQTEARVEHQDKEEQKRRDILAERRSERRRVKAAEKHRLSRVAAKQRILEKPATGKAAEEKTKPQAHGSTLSESQSDRGRLKVSSIVGVVGLLFIAAIVSSLWLTSSVPKDSPPLHSPAVAPTLSGAANNTNAEHSTSDSGASETRGAPIPLDPKSSEPANNPKAADVDTPSNAAETKEGTARTAAGTDIEQWVNEELTNRAERLRRDFEAEKKRIEEELARTQQANTAESESKAAFIEEVDVAETLSAGDPETDPPQIHAAPPLYAPASRATRVEEISWRRSEDGTRVAIKLDGRLDNEQYVHMPLGYNPTREMVKISGIIEPYARGEIEVGTPELKWIRTGHHSQQGDDYVLHVLHVVLDYPRVGSRVIGVRNLGGVLEILVAGP